MYMTCVQILRHYLYHRSYSTGKDFHKQTLNLQRWKTLQSWESVLTLQFIGSVSTGSQNLKLDLLLVFMAVLIFHIPLDVLTPSRTSWDPDDPAVGQGSSKWDIPSPAPSRDSGIGTKKCVGFSFSFYIPMQCSTEIHVITLCIYMVCTFVHACIYMYVLTPGPNTIHSGISNKEFEGRVKM